MQDSERWYVIDGEDYPSVTTVLSAVVATPFLIDWKLKLQKESIRRWKNSSGNKRVDFEDPETSEAIDNTLGVLATHAIGIGNIVHDLINQTTRNPSLWDELMFSLKDSIDESPTASNPLVSELRDIFESNGFEYGGDKKSSTGNIDPYTMPIINALEGWRAWCKDFDVSVNPELGTTGRFEIIESESLLYNKTDKYAGTADFILVDNQHPEKRMIVDIKTGGLYNDYLYQVSAYAKAYESMTGQDFINGVRLVVSNCYVLQLKKEVPKKANRYAFKEAASWRELYINGFKPAFDWWASQKRYSLGRQIQADKFMNNIGRA